MSSVCQELERQGRAVKEDEAVAVLRGLEEKVSNRLVPEVEAQDRGQLQLWKEVEKALETMKEECYKCRPSFHVQGVLDDSMLILPQIVVRLYSWNDWHRLTQAMNGVVVDEAVDLPPNKALPKGARLVEFDMWETLPGQDPFRMISTQEDGWHWKYGWIKTDGKTEWKTFSSRPSDLIKSNPAWPVTVQFHPESFFSREMSIQEVRSLISDLRGRELKVPGGPAAHAAATKLLQETIWKWKGPANHCIERALTLLMKRVQTVVVDELGQYPAAKEALWNHLQEVMRKARLDCVASLERKLSKEKCIFTLNDHYMCDSFNKAQTRIRRWLHLSINWQALGSQESDQLRALLSKAGVKLPSNVIQFSEDSWCMSQHTGV